MSAVLLQKLFPTLNCLNDYAQIQGQTLRGNVKENRGTLYTVLVPWKNKKCPVCLSSSALPWEYKTVWFHKRAGPETEAQSGTLQSVCAISFNKTN